MDKQLRELLKKKLTKKQLSFLPTSYDVVGDLLIFSEFPSELKTKEKIIGEALLSLHKNVKVVLKKTKKYSGKFRLPKLKIIAGERRKGTLYKENNIRLKLNVEKVYFSPRLATERKRIAQLVKAKESILVMFSGCSVYPIVISKNTKAREIYAIEINPTAHKYAQENVKLNKINNIQLFLGDVKNIMPKLHKKFDRIVMPLPKGGEDFLYLAFKAIKEKGIIHFYDFLKEGEFDKAKQKIQKEAQKQNKKYRILRLVKCGQFSPRKYRVCVDFKVL